MPTFGWSYPPGCDGVPDDYEDGPAMDLPTVGEFCEHVGVEPIWRLLRAIDKHNIETVDIQIQGAGEWLTPDDLEKLASTSPNDPIERFRVRGIAWDGSDWGWSAEIAGEEGIGAVDAARAQFHEELEEYVAERDAERDDNAWDAH